MKQTVAIFLFLCSGCILSSPNKKQISKHSNAIPAYIKILKDRMRVALKRKNITSSTSRGIIEKS